MRKYVKNMVLIKSFKEKENINLEEENILNLSNNIDLNQKEQIEIKKLKRGESLIIGKNNKIIIKIISNDLENNIIEGSLNINKEKTPLKNIEIKEKEDII